MTIANTAAKRTVERPAQASDLTSRGRKPVELARFVRTARGAMLFKKPIGSPISDSEYAQRKSQNVAQAAVRGATVSSKLLGIRSTRSSSTTTTPFVTRTRQVRISDNTVQVKQARTGGSSTSVLGYRKIGTTPHSVLVKTRNSARAKYPVGHPIRLKAEKAVRLSRSARRPQL